MFEESVKQREGAPSYTFYDGPPTANGRPHIGHVLTRAIKDLIPRYRTMKGYQVVRKAGWDTHGLPVELEVEKQLGLNGKDQIEKRMASNRFIEKCKESVWTYKGDVGRDAPSKRGISGRIWNDPYITYDNCYIESVWWVAQARCRGRGPAVQRVIRSCPTARGAERPWPVHEVAQGYQDVDRARPHTAVFRCVDEDACLLPGLDDDALDAALERWPCACIADVEYAKAKQEGTAYISGGRHLADAGAGRGLWKSWRRYTGQASLWA